MRRLESYQGFVQRSEIFDSRKEALLPRKGNHFHSSSAWKQSQKIQKKTHRKSLLRVLPYRNLMRWSEIFDKSDIATKKMITGYIINRVYVYSDYKLHIEFNMNMEQFLGGLEIPAEYLIQKTA